MAALNIDGPVCIHQHRVIQSHTRPHGFGARTYAYGWYLHERTCALLESDEGRVVHELTSDNHKLLHYFTKVAVQCRSVDDVLETWLAPVRRYELVHGAMDAHSNAKMLLFMFLQIARLFQIEGKRRCAHRSDHSSVLDGTAGPSSASVRGRVWRDALLQVVFYCLHDCKSSPKKPTIADGFTFTL